MGLIVRKVKQTLHYKEDEPEVYKLSQISYPVVSYEALVEEVSQSRGENTNKTKAVIDAVVNRMVHYMSLGFAVRLGEFGTFKPKIRTKTAQSADELDATNIKQKLIQFYPGKQFRTMLKDLGVVTATESLNGPGVETTPPTPGT